MAVLAPSAAAQSTVWPSSDGLLVFRSDRDGNPAVFTLDPATTTVEKLTV